MVFFFFSHNVVDLVQSHWLARMNDCSFFFFLLTWKRDVIHESNEYLCFCWMMHSNNNRLFINNISFHSIAIIWHNIVVARRAFRLLLIVLLLAICQRLVIVVIVVVVGVSVVVVVVVVIVVVARSRAARLLRRWRFCRRWRSSSSSSSSNSRFGVGDAVAARGVRCFRWRRLGCDSFIDI